VCEEATTCSPAVVMRFPCVDNVKAFMEYADHTDRKTVMPYDFRWSLSSPTRGGLLECADFGLYGE
jgi:histone H3/H4